MDGVLVLLTVLAGMLSVAALIVAGSARRECEILRDRVDVLSRTPRDAAKSGVAAPARPAPPVSPQSAAAPRPVPPVTPAVSPPREKADAFTAQTPPTAPAPAKPAAPPLPRVGLEEKLGTRLWVWLAGVSLLLAGLFFVKYSAEHGWISERVRVVLGALFGLGMIAGGSWMRARSARIAAALCGAGIATLFGCLMAAVSLYALLSPVVGFVLMAALTAGAVVLSLRHGAFVALLALVGGFVTPAVIGKGVPPAASTLTFLLLLEVAMTAVTRRRGWVSISAMMLAATIAWALLFAIFGFDDAARPWVAAFVLGSVAVYTVSAATASAAPRSTWRLAIFAVFSGVALMGLLVVIGGFSPLEFGMLGVLSTGGLVLARLDARYMPMPWITAAVGAGLLWVATRGASDARTYQWVLAGYAALFTLGAYAGAWKHPRSVAWTTLSAAAGVGYMLTARLALGQSATTWWLLSSVAAAVYVALALPLWRRDRAAVGPLALGAAAMVTLAVGWGLDTHWLATGWTMAALAAALLLERLRLTELRAAIAWLTAMACAVLVAPGPFATEAGQQAVFNVLLPQYGLPALTAALTAWRLRRAGHRAGAAGMEAVTALLAVATVSVLIRHAFHPQIAAFDVRLMEWGTYATAWLGGAAALAWIGVHRRSATLEAIGVALAFAGVAACALGAGLIANPAWRHEAVGTLPVLNGLLYVYGLPALLCGAVAAVLHRARRGYAHAFAVIALLLGAAMVAMQVRHGFHADATGRMVSGWLGLIECGTYAIAWQAMGLLIGVAGRRMNNPIVTHTGGVIAGVGLTIAALGPGLLMNPLWKTAPVGGLVILNWLLYLYGVPALLAIACAAAWRHRRAPAGTAMVAALGLLFVLISLQVRQAFHGAMLTAGGTGNAEMYAYSAAWVVYGGLLLVLGIARRSPLLRYASAAVVLLTVGKVFILDMMNLRDLYRVLSFLGLGASLLLLGYLYQRFVFQAEKKPLTPPDEHAVEK